MAFVTRLYLGLCLVAFSALLASCGKGSSTAPAPSAPQPDYSYTCDYFVDAVNGNDHNDGRSAATAWQTADQAAAYSRTTGYKPGDAICFHRGQTFLVFNGTLGAGSSGADPYNFIFYGAYGDSTLPRPVLTPAIRIDALKYWQNIPANQRPATPQDWMSIGGGIYLWPNTHNTWIADALWEDNRWLTKATTSALTDGDWYYDPSSGIYYRPSTGTPSDHVIYFDKRFSTLVIPQTSDLVISDLAFEYAGSAISGSVFETGTAEPKAMHNIHVLNSTFNYVSTAIAIGGGSQNGVAYENQDIDVSGNEFDNIRYAIRLYSTTNGPETVTNVTIDNNTISNIAIAGAYVAYGQTDVEAISLQNGENVSIIGNTISNGLKISDGLTNQDPASSFYGYPLYSTGIVIWRNPNVVLNNIQIEGNFVTNVSQGITVGAGPEDSMRSIVVANNIVTNSEKGIGFNGQDSTNMSSVAFNTLYRDGTSLVLAPLSGSQAIGNLSVDPVNFHIDAPGPGGISTVDYNGFVPDGQFEIGNPPTVFSNLASWQKSFVSPDPHSITVPDPLFINPAPVVPTDFLLSNASPLIDFVPAGMTDINSDFAGNQRPAASGKDIGAW